ncbi:MAG: APC family permease, partial [Pseudonocardia sp.]|nr:APC family permease [Pseudonocardia sp.]
MRIGVPIGLRARSPVHGLDRRNLGPAEVLAQSVSCAAPVAAMVTVPGIVAATAGPATVWSFVVATGLALLIATCIAQFTRRMAVAGSLYSLTAKGLGPRAAFTSGAALLVGYAGLVMAAVTGAAIYLDALLARLGLPEVGGMTLAAAAVVVIVVAGTLVLLGVRLSARIVLLIETVSITIMVVVLGVLLGTDAGPGLGTRGADAGLAGIAAGVLPALGAFIGFEAATALGVEARRPYRTIPRAVLWTAGVVGLLSLFAAFTQMATAGAGHGQPLPVVVLAAQDTAWLAIALDLGIATSFFACTVATGNVLVRVLFSMARDGIVAGPLGATHRRYRTPHVAILTALPVAGAVPAVLLATGMPGGGVLTLLLTVASAGFLLAYLLVCVAAPLFLRRIGELTTPPVVVSLVAAPILLLVSGAYVVTAIGGPVPIVLGALLLAGLGWFGWLRLRRPDRLRGIGVYDETSA